MRGKKRNAITLIIISVLVFSMISGVINTEVESIQNNFTLVAKTNGGGIRPDILNILKQ